MRFGVELYGCDPLEMDPCDAYDSLEGSRNYYREDSDTDVEKSLQQYPLGGLDEILQGRGVPRWIKR